RSLANQTNRGPAPAAQAQLVATPKAAPSRRPGFRRPSTAGTSAGTWPSAASAPSAPPGGTAAPPAAGPSRSPGRARATPAGPTCSGNIALAGTGGSGVSTGGVGGDALGGGLDVLGAYTVTGATFDQNKAVGGAGGGAQGAGGGGLGGSAFGGAISSLLGTGP